MAINQVNWSTQGKGYKQTELGPLPTDWQAVGLGEVLIPAAKRARQVRIEDGQRYRLLTVRLYAQGIALRSEELGSRTGTKILFVTPEGDFVFSKLDARNGAWDFVPEHLSGGLG